jgi:diketogulonate reductase-like aldo/keto reductase
MDLPIIGLGTYQLKNDTSDAITRAISCGYRAIDTATLYRNEKKVGQAIRDSLKSGIIKRSDIFVTTKVPKWHITDGKIRESIVESLRVLNIEYIDLILLHNPIDVVRDWIELYNVTNELNDAHILKSDEKQNEDGYVNGKLIRHIGVSNFGINDLKLIIDENQKYNNNININIYCNQFEVTPFLQRRELVAFCRENNIRIVSHSTLTKGEKLNHPELVKMGERNGKTSAQILLRWAIQMGFHVIPRTHEIKYLQENKDLDFVLCEDDMTILESLEEGFATHPNLL